MNFLLITFDFHPTVGGIQTRTKNYVENLTKTNNKVILVHLLNRRVMQTHFSDLIQDNKVCVEEYLGATVYRYPSRVKFLFHVFLEVIRTIRNTRIDVIHIGSGAYTPIAILFLFYAKIKGIKNGCIGTFIVVPETPFQYSGMIIEKGKVLDITKYPPIAVPAHTGITLFEPEVYDYFRRLVSLEVESSFENVICPLLAKEGRLFAINIPSHAWVPINDLKGLENVKRSIQGS